MKKRKEFRIIVAIIFIAITKTAKFALFGIVVLLIKKFYDILPVDGYGIYNLTCSVIIDIITIIVIANLFNIRFLEQFNKVRLNLMLLFVILTFFLFLLILPLVNPPVFFNKVRANFLMLNQINFSHFKKYFFYSFQMVFIVPVVEELIYRGFILNLFLKKYSTGTSLLVSSLIFAFFHLNFLGIGYLFFYGLLFGYAYYKTNSLITPILLHIAINFMATVTTVQYFELNAGTLSIYILFLGVSFFVAFMVFSAINKGENSIKFDIKLLKKR